MNVSKKLFLVGALLCSALVGRSQSFPERVVQKDLLDDACGKNTALPFSIPNLKEDVKPLRRLSCDYALGLSSLPQEIAEELKSLIEGAAGPKSMKNLQCDFFKPFDVKALFDEKEQQNLNKLINETFHK